MGLLFPDHKIFWGFFEMSRDVCCNFDGFAHHHKFGGFFLNGSHNLSMALSIFQCNIDISTTCPILF